MKVDILHLATDAGVDDNVFADKCRDAMCTPDAWGPPTALAGLQPRCCGTKRERMDHPWRRGSGVADDAMVRLQSLERLRH
jgi:hypothetical protein